jgi:hypothetical protein
MNAQEVFEAVEEWEDRYVTISNLETDGRDADYAVHLPEHRLGDFLELIDTRATDAVIDRLEPSGGEPTSHGFMYAAWH